MNDFSLNDEFSEIRRGIAVKEEKELVNQLTIMLKPISELNIKELNESNLFMVVFKNGDKEIGYFQNQKVYRLDECDSFYFEVYFVWQHDQEVIYPLSELEYFVNIDFLKLENLKGE